jgi:hypothetical protein
VVSGFVEIVLVLSQIEISKTKSTQETKTRKQSTQETEPKTMKHACTRSSLVLLLLSLPSAIGFISPFIGTSARLGHCVRTPGQTATSLESTLALPDQNQPASSPVGSLKRALTQSHKADLIGENQPGDTRIEFPPPLDRAGRLKRAASFWLSTAPIVADYVGLMGKMKLENLQGMTKPNEEIEVR